MQLPVSNQLKEGTRTRELRKGVTYARAQHIILGKVSRRSSLGNPKRARYACVQGIVCSQKNCHTASSKFHLSTASIVLAGVQLAQAECHMFLRYEPVSRTEYFCNNPLGPQVMCRKHVSRAPPTSPLQNAIIRSRSRVSMPQNATSTDQTTTPAPIARLAQGARDQLFRFMFAL